MLFLVIKKEINDDISKKEKKLMMSKFDGMG